MLRVDVTLLPGGDESRAKLLARAELANVSHLKGISDYQICAVEGSNGLTGAETWIASGTIRRHRRRQTVWKLVERAAAWAVRQAARETITMSKH
jgi:hypothetical protein